MGEVFTVTRGAQRRSGHPFVAVVGVGALVALLVVQAVRLLWEGSTGLSGAPPSEVIVFLVSWLLLAVLIASLVRLLRPFWQVARAHLDPDDVVLAVDGSGLRLADSGCEIAAPWASIRQLDLRDRTSSGFRLRLVAEGPVSVSQDPLGRVMGRRLRHGGVHLRFRDESPNDVAAAIAAFSGGRFASVPQPRQPHASETGVSQQLGRAV